METTSCVPCIQWAGDKDIDDVMLLVSNSMKKSVDMDEMRKRMELYVEKFSSHYRIALARLAGDPVGYAQGRPHYTPAQYSFENIYVEPEHCRAGVGFLLASSLIDFATSEHYAVIRGVIVDSPASRKLDTKLGMTFGSGSRVWKELPGPGQSGCPLTDEGWPDWDKWQPLETRIIPQATLPQEGLYSP